MARPGSREAETEPIHLLPSLSRTSMGLLLWTRLLQARRTACRVRHILQARARGADRHIGFSSGFSNEDAALDV